MPNHSIFPDIPTSGPRGHDLTGKEAAQGTCHKCGGSLSRGNADLAKQCGACGTRFHMSDCGGRLAAAGYHDVFDQCPKCACLCNCAEGGLALCHAYRVRKMRTKGRGRRSAAAAAAASGSMSAEATSPSKARGETDEVRQPFGNARGGPPSGPSDADTNSDVRVNAFGSSTAAGSDGPSTQADPNNYETQLWALGLLGVGDENGAGENEEREGSAHSEIGYEALMGDGPIQPVPELQNELLQLLQHKKRARTNEPEGDAAAVDDYLVF